MTDQKDQENTRKGQALREQYRKIEAPPFLASRVVANLEAGSSESRSWKPVFVSAVLLVVVALWLPSGDQEPAMDSGREGLLSLGRMSAALPAKPEISVPGFSRIKSVSAPPMSVRIPSISSTKS